MPAVSVILASYNQGEYLGDAVDSVLGQTFTDWELIVVDNGSTDGSQSLLERYAELPRIRLILHDKNEAVTRRLNHALASSKGDFLSILYSDDYYLPHKLARQMEQFSRLPHDYGVVYSPGWRLNVTTGQQWMDLTPQVSGWVLNDLLVPKEGFINPISPLIRRQCFERYPFDETLFVEGEAIFWRIAMKYLFHFDSEATVVMRDHARNVGRSVKRNVQNLLICLRNLERDPDFPDSGRATLRLAKLRMYRNAGWQAIRVVNDSSWAREMFGKALAMDWKQALHPKTITGLSLSLLPRAALATLNRAVYRLQRPGRHINYVPE